VLILPDCRQPCFSFKQRAPQRANLFKIRRRRYPSKAAPDFQTFCGYAATLHCACNSGSMFRG
jgi:hypothetical protein